MLAPPLSPLTARPRALANWLIAVAALIVAMVVIGGITRLTESGLSITQWKPVTGTLPPLSDAAWADEFARYRQIPEYREVNAGMTLAGFKAIYFWEYLHRLVGRVIGIAFAVPLAWFWVRRAIPSGYGLRLVALLALGAAQGAIGWWMVTSGLSVRTDVSHVRLAVHLCAALVILAGIVWTALDLRALARSGAARAARFHPLGAIVLVILFVQLFWGALMAGLDAGLVTNQWPLMNGNVWPGLTSADESIAGALVNDPAVVHFVHRWWAWVAVAGLILLARAAKRVGDRRASAMINAAFGTQILLVIATLMTGVPIWLAALHQLVGALLLIATVAGAHAIGRRA
jgi:cytochrome c oxidase assembly protein subunit 15